MSDRLPDDLAATMNAPWDFVAPEADEVDPSTAGARYEYVNGAWYATVDARTLRYTPHQQEANMSNRHDEETARQLGRDAFERAQRGDARQHPDRQPDAERGHVEAAKDIAAWTGAIFDGQRRREQAERDAHRRDADHARDYEAYRRALDPYGTENTR